MAPIGERDWTIGSLLVPSTGSARQRDERHIGTLAYSQSSDGVSEQLPRRRGDGQDTTPGFTGAIAVWRPHSSCFSQP